MATYSRRLLRDGWDGHGPTIAHTQIPCAIHVMVTSEKILQLKNMTIETVPSVEDTDYGRWIDNSSSSGSCQKEV